MGAPSVGLPPFHVHFETLVFLTALGSTYAFSLVHVGRPIDRHATRAQKSSFFVGVAVVYVALGWPLDDISDDYLYSAHMVQHVLLMLLAPPFFLWGTPAWLLERALPAGLLRALRRVTRPVFATLVFNAAVGLSHWPLLVDLMSRSATFHNFAHLALLAASTVMWFPVFSPTPVIPRISPPARMLYLFVQSILPTVPASFFTFAEGVLVPYYGEAPRLFGIGVIADQQLAGFVMKVVGGLVLWTYIAVVFFRWYSSEGHEVGLPGRFRRGEGGIPPSTRGPSGGGSEAVPASRPGSERVLAGRS